MQMALTGRGWNSKLTPSRFSRRGHWGWSPTARVQRGSSQTARCASTEPPQWLAPFMSFHASIFPSLGSGRTVLHCAHRTSTFRACAFCEQEGWSGRSLLVLPSLLVYLSRGWPDWSPTARVQRGESATARCASTGDQQAPSPPLLREQGISTGVIPPLSSWGLCEQEGHLAAPSPSSICHCRTLLLIVLASWPTGSLQTRA
jgi:hypothetical protein